MIVQHILGDCLDALKQVTDHSVQLIVTSPPYAEQRKKTYGGIPHEEYVEWFLARASEFKRVLKPDGTFILNIKENVVKGERSTYCMELVLALRKQGWLWTEEWIWHKRNTSPGKWPNRFRDLWEHCHQFNLNRKFKMNQEAVMVPMGDWAKSRLQNLSIKDKQRDNSSTGSGFGKDISKWVGRDYAYPGNVLHLSSESSNKGHSAVFPRALPEFFIKLFSDEGDLVVDPYSGSGTTGVMAVKHGRSYLGIDILPENIELAAVRVQCTGDPFRDM